MAESKGKIFRIYKWLKFKNRTLGISNVEISIKCDICLTNLHPISGSYGIQNLT